MFAARISFSRPARYFSIAPSAPATDAVIKITPQDADTNTEGHQVTLTAGQDNVVTITVTAPNGTDTETYTLTITHAAAGT